MSLPLVVQSGLGEILRSGFLSFGQLSSSRHSRGSGPQSRCCFSSVLSEDSGCRQHFFWGCGRRRCPSMRPSGRARSDKTARGRFRSDGGSQVQSCNVRPMFRLLGRIPWPKPHYRSDRTRQRSLQCRIAPGCLAVHQICLACRQC